MGSWKVFWVLLVIPLAVRVGAVLHLALLAVDQEQAVVPEMLWKVRVNIDIIDAGRHYVNSRV